MLLENQKQTQRRRDAKKTQRFFLCFSLRNLSAFAALREGFLFCLVIVFSLAFIVGCSKDSSQKSDTAQTEKASADSMQTPSVEATKPEEVESATGEMATEHPQLNPLLRRQKPRRSPRLQ